MSFSFIWSGLTREQVISNLKTDISALSRWLIEQSDGVSKTHHEKAALLKSKIEELQEFESNINY